MKHAARLPRLAMPQAFLPAQPALAAEIGEHVLAVVRLARAGSAASLAGFYAGELPDGAVRCSMVQTNVADPEALAAHVRAARARLASSGGPIALCVPDPIARVAVLPLESLPARDAEVQELVGWRLKKQLPFRVEEARIAWEPLQPRGAVTPVLAAAIRRKVLAEYEAPFAAEGFHVGSVTTSTLALAAALPAGRGDVLLVHAADGWFSLLWTDGAQPVLLRTKQLPGADRLGDARTSAIVAEVAPTIEYARERLQRIAAPRVLVHDATGEPETLLARLGEAGVAADVLRAVPAAGLPARASAPLASSCGLALRGLPDGVRLVEETVP